MTRHGNITIVVDDDASLRILNRVAQRCGGSVRVATSMWLQLTFPEAANRYLPQPRSGREVRVRTEAGD